MEKAILISAITPEITERQANEYLDELVFLAATASIEGVKRFLQRIDKPNSSTYVGKGKLQEIKDYIADNEIHLAVFDDELSGAQVRNLEKELNCSILGFFLRSSSKTALLLLLWTYYTARRAKTHFTRHIP